MKSLFLRIFIWFWLLMAVVVVVLVGTSPYWTRVRPAVARWEKQVYGRLFEHSGVMAQELRNEGLTALEARGRRHRGRHRVVGFLFDTAGNQVGGEPAPPEAVKLAGDCAASDEIEFERSGFSFALARPVDLDQDRDAVLVVMTRGRPPGDEGRPPQAIGFNEASTIVPRLAFIMLLVGIFCYWLARYLTSPLRGLRSATMRLAEGDLSTRVGAPIADRGDEIGGLARDFDRMAEKVELLLDSQKQLMRDVSHELRSPLARLKVALELARQRSGETARKPHERIEREVDRLDELIGEVLALVRLEAGIGDEGASHGVALEEIDVTSLLEEIVADADYEARSRGRSVDAHFESSPRIEARREWFRSAVENVLRNAVRYTAEGTTVELRCTADDGCVITIRDHGPGIPDSDLEAVFEPFVRVGAARERDAGGVGLGLAIAKRVIRMHGGRIRARNHPEGGLEVEIRLPVRRGSARNSLTQT